jgi:hypothetical protein
MAEIKPPTIGHLKRMGVTGAVITCTFPPCRRTSDIRFDSLPFRDETPFPQILATGQLRCLRCGRLATSCMPDWRDYKPRGSSG